MEKTSYSIMNSSMLLLVVLLLIIQVSPLQAAATVKFLPGYEGPLPFHLETGYVGVGKEEEHQLFYYFIKSESDPQNDPLILWLTGGPGCSSFNGVVYEIGPLYYKQKKYNGSLPTLGVTPYSWTKVANIIFLEQPVNTGFSYATTPEAMHVTDVDACKHAYEFLLKWLVDHPEFSSNNFYLAGDSYSGIVVPRVVQLISDGIEAGNKPLINLKGYMLGNPLTFPEETNFKIPFFLGMGIIPIDLYQSMLHNCKGEYRSDFAPTNAQCSQDLDILDELLININDQHVLEPSCGSETELKMPFPSTFRWRKRSLQENASSKCYGSFVDRHDLSNHWANDPRVQKALRVRKGTVDHWAVAYDPFLVPEIAVTCIDYRMASNSSSHSPRTVEEIFKDFSARHAAVLRALTADVEEFYSQCDPERDNLCLYGHPNESWEVAVPAEEVPPELPEPVLGINFARDGMERRDWLSLVAMHTDSWLLSVAFYFGARLNRNERSRVFTLINDLPTVFEAVSGRKPLKDKPSVDSGKKSKNNDKREKQIKANQRLQEESDDEDEVNEDEHEETLCGSCGTNGNEDEFWIGCDICERWFHGKCVKITPAKAQSIKEYRCPSCSSKRAKHMG